MFPRQCLQPLRMNLSQVFQPCMNHRSIKCFPWIMGVSSSFWSNVVLFLSQLSQSVTFCFVTVFISVYRAWKVFLMTVTIVTQEVIMTTDCKISLRKIFRICTLQTPKTNILDETFHRICNVVQYPFVKKFYLIPKSNIQISPHWIYFDKISPKRLQQSCNETNKSTNQLTLPRINIGCRAWI